MRILQAMIVGSALVVGAVAAHAESPDQLLYGRTQYPASTMYSPGYGEQVAVMPDLNLNPGTGYGRNSSMAASAAATAGGTNVNASNIGGGAELHMMSGRAAAVGAPPAPPVQPHG